MAKETKVQWYKHEESGQVFCTDNPELMKIYEKDSKIRKTTASKPEKPEKEV